MTNEVVEQREKVLLITVPPWGVNAPPLGVGCIASYLQEKKYAVDVYDLNLSLFNKTRDPAWWDFNRKDDWADPTKLRIAIADMQRPLQEFLSYVKKEKYRIIGFSVTQNSLLFAGYLSHEIKKMDASIYLIAGGWGCCNQHERDCLAGCSSIDAFAVGEGEEMLEDVICALRDNKSIAGVAGIVLRSDATNSSVTPRYLTKKLDEYPAPSYEGFPIADYSVPVLSIISSRGCVGRCEFCNDRVYQGKYRVRSFSQIVDEIKMHHEKYGISTFSFNDLLINGDLKNLRALCNELSSLDFPLAWVAQCMVRKDMTIDDYRAMHSAGCKSLQFGIESGSDEVLKKMNKFFTVDDAEKALRLVHEAGVEAWVNIIVGFPGETDEHFNETLDFIKRNRPYIVRIGSVNTCNVVHSSSLMKNHVAHGVTLSESMELMEVSWLGADGNCDTVRKARLIKVLELLSSLSLPIGQDNLFATVKKE